MRGEIAGLGRWRTGLAAAAWLACVGPAVAQPIPAHDPPQIGQVSKDSVWVPTPERVIRRMLQLADTTRDDFLVDLGCGDGRIPIYAARHFGARALGVELEANLVSVAVEAAQAAGVAQRARFVRQDLFETDLSGATVIALYISPGVMTRLQPRLLALRPGTRIVSHQFRLDEWEPDESVSVEGRSAYLWVVPVDARGLWTVHTGEGENLRLRVDQAFQRLVVRAERGGRPVHVLSSKLRGTEISFSAFDPDGGVRHYRGRVDGDRMAGESQGEDSARRAWSAQRD